MSIKYMTQGFKKLKEATSIYPSRRHLYYYNCLITADEHDIFKKSLILPKQITRVQHIIKCSNNIGFFVEKIDNFNSRHNIKRKNAKLNMLRVINTYGDE